MQSLTPYAERCLVVLNREDYTQAGAAFVFATALALLEIDRIPKAERTTDRITSFLQECGNTTAGTLPSAVSIRLHWMIDHLGHSVRDLQADDQAES